jgi:pimeloyl-ACP methyl ester carboxylesterase
VKALAAFSRARRARIVDEARFAAAATPTLGIAGSLDPELEALRSLKALRPDLEIVTVEGATHAGDGRVIDRSECLAAIRRFLGRAANPLGAR